MAHDGSNGNRSGKREGWGGVPYVRTRFSLGMENEQADAGRDSRTLLARPNSQARTGTGKILFSLFS